MLKESLLSKKSFIDFTYMFLSNVIKKVFGFFREMILAFFFGSSMVYANYLLLKTVAEFFSQLTLGNALQANLLPKFTKLYLENESIDLSNVYSFSKLFMWKLFFVSQLVQLPLIWIINPENKLIFILISILLGFVMSINFFNSVFLTVLQAKGEFKKHSVATTLNLFVSVFFLYPLALFFEIIGVVISRLLGVLTLLFKYIRPLLLVKGSKSANLELSDFNLSIMLLGNFANIIILLGRFVAGIGGGNEITFFNYSTVLLYALFTAIILNVNTLVLKFISVKKNNKIVFLSTLISSFVVIVLVVIVQVYSIDIVSLLFERGAFNSSDTLETATYLRDISWSFIFIFLASSLFQPYFTLPQSYLKKRARYLANPFLISVGVLLVYFYSREIDVKLSSLLTVQFLSIVAFILSLFSFRNYLRYESK